MTILVVGGGIFVGRALVASAQARGHRVTVFNRGQASVAPPGVEQILGDRNTDLDRLRGRTWDAIIDTSAYLPGQVQSLAGVRAAAAPHYTLVSTIMVYAGFAALGQTEAAPLAAPAAPSVAAVSPQTYGPLKVACELAAAAFPRRLVVRPGIIVGPGDATGRFTYWVRRAVRGGEMLAPGSPADPLQLIDVRDLAAWILQMVERRQTGVYNAVGRPDLTWGEAIGACLDAAGAGAPPTWVGGDFLIARGADDWAQLPLVLPAAKRDFAGIYRLSGTAAAQQGLELRPLRETVAALLDWTRRPEAVAAKQPGLSPAAEAELLAAWRAAGN